MSTLTVSNISDATTTVGTSYVVNGSAKAWINLNGTGTIATRDSFNVGSITDNGTGNYSINFSNNMSNANYSVSGAANHDSYFTDTLEPFSYSAGSINLATYSRGNSATGASAGLDLTYVNTSVHGDLA